MFSVAWRWWTTTPDWAAWHVGHETALVAIASIAAIIWTGGLIAYQLKQHTLERVMGLDLVQAAFMGALFALFMSPIILRSVAAMFTIYYCVIHLYLLTVTFRSNENTRKILTHTEQPLPEDELTKLRADSRKYSYYTLGSLLVYILVVIWPLQIVVSWVGTALIFMGYQLVLRNFNMAPDKGFEEIKLTTLTTILRGIGVLQEQLNLLIRKS